MPATTSPTPAQTRQHQRQLRRSLSVNAQDQHARAIAGLLSRFNPYRYCNKLAFYLANDGEIDPRIIINHAWNMGKQVFLPVLSPLKNQLYFAPYQNHSVLTANRFGIDEPACHPKLWLRAQQLDVLFLPLVAYDNAGNRIGMGGGFYDRSLAYLSTRQTLKKPRLIGLAHDFQECDSIIEQPWDIPLDMIVTEKRMIQVEK